MQIKLILPLLISIVAILSRCVQQTGANAERQRKCQEITIPMCRGIPYNLTSYPNRFNHDTQEEAGLEVHQFWPLVEINCSPDLRFFLCSMYAPICMPNYPRSLPVCRSVCQRAKVGCAPLMRQYGFSWPERMNCDELPVFGDRELCMEEYNVTGTSTGGGGLGAGGIGGVSGNGLGGNNRNNLSPLQPGVKPPTKIPTRNPDSPPAQSSSEPCKCQCRSPLIEIRNRSNRYFNSSVAGVGHCAINCDGIYLDAKGREFLQVWLSVWSVACCLSSLVTMLTFLVDTRRFQYPERPIVFISACYLLVGVAYIIRLIAGHDSIVCDINESDKVLRNNASESALCIFVFLLLYYFGMASNIWWVMLAFTWFLSAGLKWGQEAIAGCGQYFHIVAWLLPSIKCIIILVTSLVDVDSVAGICYVGNNNTFALKIFVLIPLCVYLVLGIFFLFAGFIALFRIRKALQQQVGAQRTEKLDRLMVRVGVFSVLYTIPAIIVISCYFYEHQYRDKWQQSAVCQCTTVSNEWLQPSGSGAASSSSATAAAAVACQRDCETHKPEIAIFLLKYLMTLLVGVSTGFWVCTAKTVSSWRRCCEQVATTDQASRNNSLQGKKALQHQQRLLKSAKTPSALQVHNNQCQLPS